MHRLLIQSLREWKISSARQPLLLRGARQTGKTYLIRQFGKSDFKQILEINFERDKQYLNCFDTLNVKDIIQTIEIKSGQTIIPGETLLFLDEIQECPNAIQALRYFFEQYENLHVIGAGSLLEFALKDKNFSMPVGRVEYLHLYPLTFNEMLQALNKEKLLSYINNISIKDKIPAAIHQELLKQLRLYFVLGGMPRVVYLYAEHEKLLACRQAQSNLLNTYRDDFAKYASLIQQKYCERVFTKSFGLIAKNFKYTDIDPDMDYRSLKQAIHLLCKANILTQIYYSKASGLPLSATRTEKKYKLLFLDLGLAQAAGRISPELLLDQDLMQINKGSLTEQFIGQHLLTIQPNYEQAELFYWQRDAKGSQAEIDYVISVDNQIIPIEVKSGKTGRLKSLHSFMGTHNTELGLKLSTDEFDLSDNIWSIPLYLVEQIPRLVRERS